MRTIYNLLDTNRDQKIEASELRQAVQTGVSTLFLMADTNQDGQLSPYELNAAVGKSPNRPFNPPSRRLMAIGTTCSSIDEYDKALVEPAHAVFRVLDANNDNQLSLDELQRAEQIIQDQIAAARVPEATNSMSNQLHGGPRASRSSQSISPSRVRRPRRDAPPAPR